MARSVYRRIRNNVLIGLFLVIPMAVTGFVAALVFNFLTRNSVANALTDGLLALLPDEVGAAGYKRALVRIVAFLIMVLGLFLIGAFVRGIMGRKFYHLGEMVIGRIPFINRVYLYVRQISEAFLAQRQTLLREVVLIEYPRAGIYSMGFVTADTPAAFTGHLPGALPSEPCLSVFIPTTPNPTSGLFVIVPRSQARPVPISVADGMKLVISAGAVYPGQSPLDNRPTLLDKLEKWLGGESRPGADAP